jgi:hypothetical protein
MAKRASTGAYSVRLMPAVAEDSPSPAAAEQIDPRAHFAERIPGCVDAIDPRDGIENDFPPLRLPVVHSSRQRDRAEGDLRTVLRPSHAGIGHAGRKPAWTPLAKGLMCSGTFTPSREAAELTLAPHASRLTMSNRGDWTPLELFIAGVRLMQTLEPLTCQEIISFSTGALTSTEFVNGGHAAKRDSLLSNSGGPKRLSRGS